MKIKKELVMFEKSISYYIKLVLKKWYVVFLCTILFTALGYGWAKMSHRTETYTAETKVLTYHKTNNGLKKITVANEKGKKITRYAEQRKIDLSMMSTYESLVTSDQVMQNAVNLIDSKKVTAETLRNDIMVERADKSLVMTISAKSSSEKNAVKIANAVAKSYKENANSLINVGKVEILQKASSAETASGQATSKKPVLFGLLAGLYLGVMAAVLFKGKKNE